MATVYLNAATGNDSNTYAQAQNPATPWLTPGKVQSAATTGDSVVMAAGTYAWASITFTKVFTWTGATPVNGFPTTILDGAAGSIQWTIPNAQTFSNIKFYNSIPATAFTNKAAFCASASGFAASFSNCLFDTIVCTTDNTTDGGVINLYNAATSLSITNCLFRNITRNSATSGRIIGGITGAMNLSVINSVFYLTGSGASALTHIFAQSSTTGATLLFKNNIVYNGQGSTLNYQTGTISTNTYNYNCGYLLTSPPAGTGNITTDPLFVDAANGNFNLRPGSGALDTGSL